MRRFVVPLLMLIAVYLVGIIAYHTLEGWNYIDSIYFATTTLTTLGSSELHPTSNVSKLFTVLYIWVCVGTGFYILYNISEYYKDVISKKAENLLEESRRRLTRSENKNEKNNENKNELPVGTS